MDKKVTILIRTSNRPILFNRALASVYSQTYKNIDVIVSYDTENRPDYIPEDIKTIKVTKQEGEAFYNLYLNDLKEQVNDGWFFFLDDDDYLQRINSLEFLVPHLTPITATMCQFIRKERRKPLTNIIESGKVGLPNIILHHSQKNLAKFDSAMNADYKFIKSISEQIPVKFVPLVLVETDRRSRGRMYA